jgi:DDE superfamily endonuclease
VTPPSGASPQRNPKKGKSAKRKADPTPPSGRQPFFDLIMSVYTKKTLLSSLPLTGAGPGYVLQSDVQKVLDEISPLGLIDDDNSTALSRRIRDIICASPDELRVPCTDLELRAGIERVIRDSKYSQSKCAEELDVGLRTVKRKIHDIRARLLDHNKIHLASLNELQQYYKSDTDSAADVNAAISYVNPSKLPPGPSPYLNETDKMLIVMGAGRRSASGLLGGNRYVAQTAGEVIRALGAQALALIELNPDSPSDSSPAGKRLRKTAIDMTKNQPSNRQGSHIIHTTEVPNAQVVLVVASETSCKRLKSMHNSKSTAFCRMVKASFAADVASGKFPPDWEPTPGDFFNMDEVGINPEGVYGKTVHVRYDGDSSSSRMHFAKMKERAAFHTSLLLCSCGDGSLAMPLMVIREGAPGSMTSDKMLNLPPDWLIATSQSAYNNQGFMTLWFKEFVKISGAGPGKWKFLLLDGHQSHTGGEFLRLASQKFVQVIFLRSNASIVDQPNDNGINARFKARYADAFANFRMSYPTPLPITPALMNKVLAAAWDATVTDVTSARVVTDAFVKTRVF